MNNGTLGAEILGRFACAKVFKADEKKAARVTGLDFSRCGQFIYNLLLR